MSKTRQKGFINKSLERALQILISFNVEQKAMTLSEIANAAALPKSTAFRLCSTLTEQGFLKLDKQTNRYFLGTMIFRLGGIVYASFSLNRIVAPYLDELYKIVQQTIVLDILSEDHVMHIDKRENPFSSVRYGPQLGARRPPYYGSTAQLLMAYLPENEIDRLLKKFPLTALTEKSIVDEKLYKERLHTIRSQGYAIDLGEAVESISTVGAPIRDHTGKVLAAVAVGWISQSLDNKKVKNIIEETVKTAAAISKSMGYMDIGE